MITKNFIQYNNLLLQRLLNIPGAGVKALLPVTNTQNQACFLANGSASTSSYYNLVLNSTNSGVSVGSGTTPPTINDYNLESTITSGLSAATPVVSTQLDENGNPYVKLVYTINNISQNSITISEIGAKIQIFAATTQGASATSSLIFLLDRTLLDSPVTIPAGEYAVIEYVLKTVIPT